jgi:hypothetical protein
MNEQASFDWKKRRRRWQRPEKMWSVGVSTESKIEV